MPLCKFCNLKESVKKSHIIPEFMYQHTYDAKHKMVVADDTLDELGERQKGYYEPLLCVDCEQYFNDNFEKPCLSFMKKVPSHAKQGTTVCFDAMPSLELLLLSVIWRASHATGNHWRGVNLGPHESIIKKCLETNATNPSYMFWLYLAVLPDGKIEKGIVSSIQKLNVKGHHLYHFLASGVQFIIKISSHKLLNVTPKSIRFDRTIDAEACDIKHVPSMRVIFNK